MVLRNADGRLTLDAAHGGAIRDFSWRGLAVLRPAAAGTGSDPFATACFPLVPYANRIAHGRFAFAGRSVQLRRNWDRDPHPLHGQGWRCAWSIGNATATRAVLTYDGGGDDWPWRYRAEQGFALLEDGLEVRLSIENRSGSAMPGMLGLHPYFPAAGVASVAARTRTLWLTDAEALPVEAVPTPPEYSFDAPRPPTAVALDHCFDDWDGVASVRWPDRALTVTATGCRSLHVYAPAGGDFFCLEPQTAAAGALNRGSGEVARLAPGERLEMRVRFSLEAA
ncbi:MAG TPA: aldose 1-epimerase [Steroidobacteraceae bacterium]|nr:aldose 1-epimerase [Steroidobacteraceae bacterium]